MNRNKTHDREEGGGGGGGGLGKPTGKFSSVSGKTLTALYRKLLEVKQKPLGRLEVAWHFGFVNVDNV